MKNRLVKFTQATFGDDIFLNSEMIVSFQGLDLNNGKFGTHIITTANDNEVYDVLESPDRVWEMLTDNRS